MKTLIESLDEENTHQTPKSKDVNVIVGHQPTTYVFKFKRDKEGKIESVTALPVDD